MALESNYRELQHKLAKLESELKKATDKKLREIGAEDVAGARARASWSKTIPAAIVPAADARGAGIRVKKSPAIAILNERLTGQWRHPVFGNRSVWVTQRARPSVRPVVDAERARLKQTAEEIMRDAERAAGFR